MLANRLPGVRTEGYVNNGVMLECACYALFAYYNLTSMTGRALQSFQNAWNQIYWRGYQRVGGSTPAWSLAKIDDGSERGRFVIAVEGTTSYRQFWTWTAGSSHQSASPMPGVVWNPYWQYASDILAVLATNGEWTAAMLNNHPLEVICTGHSLGAGVAEVLAYRLKNAYPWLRVKWCKFGSPKVGNTAWYQGRNRQVMGRNVRTWADLAHTFHRFNVSTANGGVITYPTGLSRLVVDPLCETILRRGEMTVGYRGEAVTDSGVAVREYFETRAGSNCWLWHDMKAYRRLLQFKADDYQDLLFYRMRYMEMPDEWNEQATTRDVVDLASLAYNQAGDAPAAVTVPQRFIDAYNRGYDVVADGEDGMGGGGEDWGVGDDGGGGGDGWGGIGGDSAGGGGQNWGGDTDPVRFGDYRLPLPETVEPRRRRRVGVR